MQKLNWHRRSGARAGKKRGPVLSVIVPVYNVDQYLSEALTSVVRQSFRDMEIICVNDGSTDNSAAVLESFRLQDERIRVITQENQGLSAARNRGFDAAAGEYIYYFDSDDLLKPDAFEALVCRMEEDDLELLFFDVQPFAEEGVSEKTLQSKEKYYHRSGEYSGVLSGLELMVRQMENNEFLVGAWGYMARRSFVLKQGLRFEEGLLYEDNLYTFSAMMYAERAGYLNRVFFLRRLRNGSITQSQKNFLHAYSYFVTHIKSYVLYQNAKQAFSGVQEKKRWIEAPCIMKFICQRLRLGRNIFAGLDVEERNKSRELPEEEQGLFQLYMEDACPGKEKERDACHERGSEEKTIWFFGSPSHGNLGDHMIAEAALSFFNDRYPDFTVKEIPRNDVLARLPDVSEHIKPGDLVFYIGGGNLGNYWPENEKVRQEVIRSFPGHKKIILPQSIQFTDDEAGREALEQACNVYADQNLLLVCRGKSSLEFAEKHFACASMMAPDMVMGYQLPVWWRQRGERNGAVLCFRNDKEKVLTKEETERIDSVLRASFGSNVTKTDMVRPQGIAPGDRRSELAKQYRLFSGAEVVVTDRLHCMIFCAQTGTPCVVFPNDHHKIAECYEWIAALPYIRMIKDDADLSDALTEVRCATDREYPLIKLRAHISEIEKKI